MGHKTTVPASGSFTSRDKHSELYFNRVHRVKVTEVIVDKGLIKVGSPVDEYVAIPLLGLSTPPSSENPQEANFNASSWGRYIPQVGDVVIVAYGTNGRPYTLGYSTTYYEGFEVGDLLNEETGGIGWGTVSEKGLKPGDWDFRSSRGCQFYMGDRTTWNSGTCSISMIQSDQEMTLNSSLINQKAGQSIIRYGNARRLVLPTDFEESYIYAPLERTATVAQEFSIDMRWNNGLPEGASLAYFGMGDVIDDLTKTSRISSNVFPVRMYFSATDQTGLIESYVESVDSLGNYDVTTNTAISFKWLSPLAAWDITNLSTSVTCTESFNVAAGLQISMDALAELSLTGSISATLDSSVIVKLGANAVSPVLRGTDVVNAITVFNSVMIPLATTAATAATPIPADILKLAAAWGGLATNLPILLSSITAALSSKVLVE